MDLDVFVSAHRAEWDRLDALLRRRRRLTGAEADELVALYQRTATHLSLIQSSAPDPQLTGRLSQLVARARSAVTGTRRASWRDVDPLPHPRLPRRGLPITPLVGPHRAALHRRRRPPGLVDRHPPRGAVLHRGPERTARAHPPGRPSTRRTTRATRPRPSPPRSGRTTPRPPPCAWSWASSSASRSSGSSSRTCSTSASASA